MCNAQKQNHAAPLTIDITTTAYAVWVAVSGELDVSNHDHIRQALLGLSLVGTKLIRLQLANLRFCDVRGMRHLLTFIRQAEDAGHHVVIEGVTRELRRLCELVSDGKVSLDRSGPDNPRQDIHRVTPLRSPGHSSASKLAVD